MTVILGCKKGSNDAAVSALRLFNLTYFKSWLICFIVIIIVFIIFLLPFEFPWLKCYKGPVHVTVYLVQ